ncbi:MAG: TlpA family protein disulfide reductase [Fidelibacterota bacterium]
MSKIILFIFPLVLFFSNFQTGPQEEVKIKKGVKKQIELNIGDEGPSFYLRDLNGEGVFLRDYTGEILRKPWLERPKHIVILSFFATYCIPCKKELPLLQKIHDDYSSKGVKVFLIDIMEKKEIVISFLEELKVNLPVLMDTYGVVAEKYGVTTLPRLFILDRNGKIALKRRGLESEEEFVESVRGTLDKLLKAEEIREEG